MTTNAIDRIKQMITSDSRWSSERGDFVIYVDDTGFDKIADREIGSIICAGDAILIDQWRQWFMSPQLNTAAMPRTERAVGSGLESITVSYVQRGTGRVHTYNGWYLDFGDHAKFSGSGAVFAHDCFTRNRCAITCIGSAVQRDPFSGGNTMFVDAATGRNNLSRAFRTLADVHTELDNRGEVMNMKNGKRMPFKVWAADPASGDRALSAKDITLSAPTGQPSRAWTQEERDEFKSVLDQDLARHMSEACSD